MPRSANAGKNARCICGKIIYAAFPLGDKELMQFIQGSVYKANNKTEPECLLRSFMPDEYKYRKRSTVNTKYSAPWATLSHCQNDTTSGSLFPGNELNKIIMPVQINSGS